jgi:hypothetical protein
MKKLLPIVLMALVGFSTFTSCKKKSSSSACTCKYKGATGNDTTGTFTTVDSGYSSLSAECSVANTAFSGAYGSGYGCHM